jgi:uncharacterized protein
LKVAGNFNVTGPLETFANAGGVHLARALLAEFAENVCKLVAEDTAAIHSNPLVPAGEKERAAPQQENEQQITAVATELSGGRVLWRAFVSWVRQLFFGKREAQ